MIAALDVHYAGTEARAACVLFAGWADAAPSSEHVVRVAPVAPYEPGEFRKRELPCLLRALDAFPVRPEVVIVDGYVTLGPDRPGLGAHLHEALGGIVPVIGVAKSRFAGAPAVEVRRGSSTRPLLVTAAGMEAADAAALIASMHGAHRIPTLLQRADALSRTS